MKPCGLSMGLRSRPARRWVMTVALACFTLAASAAAVSAAKAKNASRVAAKPESKPDAKSEDKLETVRISFQTIPPRKAFVKWGKKLLGVIPAPHPLVVERPRDSGPMDVVIRANGYLPVHTRAYTFSDSRVAVKLTEPTDKKTLFGYREEPPPNPDGGVPPVPERLAAPQPVPPQPGAPQPGTPR